MPKTVTVTLPAGKDAEELFSNCGMKQMLLDSHACIDFKKDAALKGKIQLYINEVETEFEIKEICDASGIMSEATRSALEEWIYNNLANQ